MRKYIRVKMNDGTIWDVPATLVATDRADYYDEKEPGCWQEEYDFTMEEEDELLDWALNNMNWGDVVEHAKMVGRNEEASDYQKGWVNGEHEVVTY